MNTKAFHQFSLLPPEIRTRIWTLVLNTPAIIQLCFDCEGYAKHRITGAYTGGDTNLILTNRHIPSLLHVNRESRSQALKIHPDTVPGRADTYVNPELDTVCFGSGMLPYPFECVYDSLENHGGMKIDRLKHLAVDINWWNTFEGTYWWRDYLYSTLESFTIYVEDPDEGEVRFEEIEQGDDSLLWDYDHEVGFGIKNECKKERGNLETALEEILEDDEYSHYIGDWKVPEVRILKLRGSASISSYSGDLTN
ncbi:hypothetical protein BKA64DRAFT_711818 [Cadophora sp. MPI-SDFR-AT-0126]|nr:hypothetical protein BKA64DRAFT_711818 [Leotiomycetes sp. MPI-SDFR-AT-0126]